VKHAPNPRGMEQIVSPTEATAAAYTLTPIDQRTAEEVRAARIKREAEIRQQEADEEQGSCKGGMCSA
jgi:hypothetical protein